MPPDVMKKNIINAHDLPWQANEHGDFVYEDKWLGRAVSADKLGASLYRLPPGKKCFPYHYHHANEEAIFVLEGEGTLRMNNELIPIKAWDYIAFPIGADYAHQMINSSHAPLVFLCFSTMIHPDISVYPDSNKIGVTAGTAPGGDPTQILMKLRFRQEEAVDYFDKEK